MISVGIRELKNNLSRYLRDVKKGKPVTVTERGQSIAILIPARSHPDAQIAQDLSRKGIGSWKGASLSVVLGRWGLRASPFLKSFLKNAGDPLSGYNLSDKALRIRKGTPATKQLVETMEVIATSRLAYVEARAAFARKRRERGIDPRDYRNIVQNFDSDWESYFVVDVSEALIKMAGQLAEKHALRGYYAIHLASAVTLLREGDQPLAFSCFDGHLSVAARREGLKMIS